MWLCRVSVEKALDCVDSISFRFTAKAGIYLERQFGCCMRGACVYVLGGDLIGENLKGRCAFTGKTQLRRWLCLSVSAWTEPPLFSSTQSALPDAQNGTNWSLHIHACRGSAAWKQHQWKYKLQTFCSVLQRRLFYTHKNWSTWIINLGSSPV